MTGKETGRSDFFKIVFCCFILTFLAILVFSQVRSFEFVSYDDSAFVAENPYVNDGLSIDGIRWALTYEEEAKTQLASLTHPGVENLWHPLTWLSLMIDAEIWGIDSPGGFHVTSVVLHLVSSILIFFSFRQLFRSNSVGVISAALFLVHPLHVETATWISERKGALSGVFFHLAFLIYLHSRQGQRRSLRLASTFAFLFAVAAKPSVIVLPVLLVATDWFQHHSSNRQGNRKTEFSLLESVRTKWPFFLVAVIGVLTTLYFQYSGSHSQFMDARPFSFRLQTMAASLLFYAERTLVPLNLSFHYPFSDSDHVDLWNVSAWLVVGAVAFFLWKFRDRIPEWHFAGLWFGICWLPVSGIFYVGTSYTADRYAYLGLTGGFAAIAMLLISKFPRHFAWGGGLTLVIAFALLAHKQVGAWRNSETLFSTAIRHQPFNPIGYTNLAGVRQEQREFTKAAELYRSALTLDPASYLAAYNLGNCAREIGNIAEAEENYLRAIRLFPEFSSAHLNLGILYARRSTADDIAGLTKAATSVRRACELMNYRDPAAIVTLMTIETTLGNVNAAKELIEKAKKLPQASDPNVREAIQTAIDKMAQ